MLEFSSSLKHLAKIISLIIDFRQELHTKVYEIAYSSGWNYKIWIHA